MVVAYERLVDRYHVDDDLIGSGVANPVLYRFVLPKPYFNVSSTVEGSQMPDENLVDPYAARNQRILADLIARETHGRKGKTQSTPLGGRGAT